MSTPTVLPDALRRAAHTMIDNPGDWYLLVSGPVTDRHNIGTWAYRARRGLLVPLRNAIEEAGVTGYWEATVRTIPLPVEEGGGKSVRCYVRFVEGVRQDGPILVDKPSEGENTEVVSQ